MSLGLQALFEAWTRDENHSFHVNCSGVRISVLIFMFVLYPGNGASVTAPEKYLI